MSYEQWSTRVGKHLKIDPTRLRFAPISQQSGQPKSYVKRSTSRNLSYVLRGTSSFFEHDNRREDRLFYEILEESLSEYETKKLLKISWLPDGIVNEVCGVMILVILYMANTRILLATNGSSCA